MLLKIRKLSAFLKNSGHEEGETLEEYIKRWEDELKVYPTKTGPHQG